MIVPSANEDGLLYSGPSECAGLGIFTNYTSMEITTKGMRATKMFFNKSCDYYLFHQKRTLVDFLKKYSCNIYVANSLEYMLKFYIRMEPNVSVP